MLSDFDVEFVERGYGKNYVRLLHVRREGKWHHVKEIEVNTRIKLNDTKDYTKGDNSDIVATDSQKNTVYILAKKHGIENIEKFAIQICQHFLTQYDHVVEANIHIEEAPWKRINKGGMEHVHAFISSPEVVRVCDVIQRKHGHPQVSAGIKGMKIMKTTQSAFVNFVQDEYRSLPDMDDRIFCTVVESTWWYKTLQGLDFDKAWETVKTTILEQFAGPPDTGVFSPSVQQTLYLTQKAALSKVPQMQKMRMVLPNVHAYTFDFTKFKKLGITENNEVFQPTDKPSGNITATLERRKLLSKI